MKTSPFLLALFLILGSAQLFSQDFSYTPKNPAFGGSFYNYQWMLSSAQVQDQTTDPAREQQAAANERDPLRDFEESLNRQILSQLSREIVRNQFGEAALQEGTYTIGSYQLDVSEDLGGLNVVILDVSSGSQTELFIPYY